MTNTTDPQEGPPAVGQRREGTGKPAIVDVVAYDKGRTDQPWQVKAHGSEEGAWQSEGEIDIFWPTIISQAPPANGQPATDSDASQSGAAVPPQSEDELKASDLVRVPEKLWGVMSPADREAIKRALVSLKRIEHRIDLREQFKANMLKSVADAPVRLQGGPHSVMRNMSFGLNDLQDLAGVYQQVEMVDRQIEELKRQSSVRVTEIYGFINTFGFDYLEVQREKDSERMVKQRQEDLDTAERLRKEDLAIVKANHNTAMAAVKATESAAHTAKWVAILAAAIGLAGAIFGGIATLAAGASTSTPSAAGSASAISPTSQPGQRNGR